MKLYQTIAYTVNDRIAYITLNRPEKRNALNDVLLIELKDAIMRAENTALVKVVVVNANGPVFCAGADLEYVKKMQAFTLEENMGDSRVMGEVFQLIYRSSKIFIAQVEGHAMAAGCGLVSVCDFAFVVPEAQFGYTEARVGFVPAIAMVFLLRKIGETRAKELMLSADMISADKAMRYDLINNIIPADQIQGYVFQFATRLCVQNSSASMQLTKKMAADLPDLPLNNALTFAAKMNAYARATDDCKRGIHAFLNKEKITW